MAPGRIAVGGLATAAVVLALVVAGCGGGDSSAPATTSGGPATAGGATSTAEAEATNSASDDSQEKSGTSNASGKGSQEAAEANVHKKKHPPIQLPTGKPEQGATKEQLEAVPTADITVAVEGGALSAANSCKGKNLSPALEWRRVPPDTAELALFVMNLQPVEGKLYFDWAVAGIDPSLQGLKAGEVPDGAVVGRNSAGKTRWDLCPPGSASENYVFALYAIPKSLRPKPGFDPLELRKEATAVSDSVGLYSVAY